MAGLGEPGDEVAERASCKGLGPELNEWRFDVIVVLIATEESFMSTVEERWASRRISNERKVVATCGFCTVEI
jgi:hypothetical protein